MNFQPVGSRARPFVYARPSRVAPMLLLATLGVAHAQSSVTLYGVVDSGIEYVNNVGVARKSVWRMPTLSGNLPSRWGMTGRKISVGETKPFSRSKAASLRRKAR